MDFDMDMNDYFDNITDSFFKGSNFNEDSITQNLVNEISNWSMDTYNYYVEYVRVVVPDDTVREEILYHIDMAIMPTIKTCQACTEDFKLEEYHQTYCPKCEQDGI